MKITSSPGQGTQVWLDVPYMTEAEEPGRDEVAV